MWFPLALEPAAEQNKRFSTRPSSRGRSGAVLAISWERAASHMSGLPVSGPLYRSLDNFGASWDTGGTALLQEARRAGLGDDSAQGGAALEDAGGRPRRRADWGLARDGAVADGASCRGKMCWMASVCFCTAENSWAESSTVSPNSPAWETGGWTLSTSLISARLSHRWHSWATSVDITFPRGRAVTFVTRRACRAEAAWPAALQALAVRAAASLQALDGRWGQFLQVAAICWHRCTATALSTWVMSTYPLAAPPSRLVRMGETDEQLPAEKGAVHKLTSSSCTSGKKGTGAGRDHEPRRARDWEVCTPPARCSRWPGKARPSTLGPIRWRPQHPRGAAPRIFILRGRLPIPRCCYRHLILYRRAEWNAGHAVRRHSRITGEPHRTAAAGGVKGPWGLARREGSHCDPQTSQSTSRWFSAHGREASAGRDRGSPSHPREEREARSQRCHGYMLKTNA